MSLGVERVGLSLSVVVCDCVEGISWQLSLHSRVYIVTGGLCVGGCVIASWGVPVP